MRVKTSQLIAGGLALALVGWLASGQLGGEAPSARTDPAAILDAAGGSAAADAPIPSVRVRTIIAEPVEREIVINGRTAAARSVTLRAETSARVIAIGARRGRTVTTGELLVELDPRERQAMVDGANATLKMRQIEHEAAKTLGAKGFQAETRVAEALANLEAAEAVLEHRQIELAHTEIRAPFPGVLEARPLEIGDFVDIGDPIATVIEQDPFLVVGDVAETEIGWLRPGMVGTARLVTGQTVQGELRYVGSRADAGTRTFEVELEIPNPDGRFVEGVSAELRIVYAKTDAHRVSPGVLTLSDAGEVGIKAVDAEDQVVFHPARVIRAQADAVWLADLPPELDLITVGQGFVQPGQTVRAVPETVGTEPSPLVAQRRPA